ncbi:MAG: MBL fold metallo-hydrolase [Patulibacter sp.]|nr:MBL fold metallo-hydrolase [Patulibacter sp.]
MLYILVGCSADRWGRNDEERAMRLRMLGWSGIEIEADGATVVVDALEDAAAVFAPLVGRTAGLQAPPVLPPTPGTAVAGLVTHLHRDHADAAALVGALRPDAPVLGPPPNPGEQVEGLALAQAEHDLAQAGVELRAVAPWDVVTAGPFTLTALPAVDGLGDPQVSWLIEADGVRVLHLGDTMFHGYWWRMVQRHGPFDAVLVPVNGAVVAFPHRTPASPLPAAMDPEQAAIAAQILGASVAIPIHGEGYVVDGTYRGSPDPSARFVAAATERGVTARILGLGEAIELSGAAAPS